jgi:hypothetical protein
MALATLLFISFVALFTAVPQWTGHRSIPEQEVASRELFVRNARFMHRDYIYLPPARKSVVVDSEGQAQRSADGMQMTRRDRSRKIYASSAALRIDSRPAQAPAAPGVSAAQPVPVEVQPEAQTPVIAIEREVEPVTRAQATPPLMPPLSPLSPEAVPAPPIASEEMPVPALEPAADAPLTVEPQAVEPPQAVEAPVVQPSLPVSEETVRAIYRMILDDPALPEKTRETIQVASTEDGLALRGNVFSQTDKIRYGQMAQQAAGPVVTVDNQLIVVQDGV